MKGVLVVAVIAACATVEVVGFTVGVANFGLRRKTLDLKKLSSKNVKNLCMQNDEINTKKVAGALGGLLGNLKSGRGLFGEETTQKYARQALEIVEEQVLEVAREIREEEGATQVKKSDRVTKRAAISKPMYTKDDKWDVILTGTGGQPLEVSVRPTSGVRLLLKAWATENGGDSVDYQLEIKSGTSWVSGVADAESLIGDSGVLDGLQVVITKIN